ncbi:tRNA (adenosine(37)-N6)-threonylcarbamoyltransferase complex ATPase subunit type 1 TsaE [Candidatus Nomurabacteria bacterium]|nr:tRNA (adenosine(37)-N6)-threonylcarbamoyltransferase complex ATPase subunit type 1 TsaE [Candidatus Kaiserbacteria bacterium]MCB9814498.1 tRNA (adenosine(37)-N6)-threonylcarbamoyltransferase complex ATPase subunit type 1 TsaE [Candidatus Nomurabacteria bacterium]
MNQEFVVGQPAEFSVVIKAVLEEFSVKKAEETLVIALVGDLGAGKTTFTQILGQTLGVTEHITSPTFTIMKTYSLNHNQFDNLVHMDAYRIEDETELVPLKFSEILNNPRTIVCIEWPEKISSIVPQSAIKIAIKIIDNEKRKVFVSG